MAVVLEFNGINQYVSLDITVPLGASISIEVDDVSQADRIFRFSTGEISVNGNIVSIARTLEPMTEFGRNVNDHYAGVLKNFIVDYTGRSFTRFNPDVAADFQGDLDNSIILDTILVNVSFKFFAPGAIPHGAKIFIGDSGLSSLEIDETDKRLHWIDNSVDTLDVALPIGLETQIRFEGSSTDTTIYFDEAPVATVAIPSQLTFIDGFLTGLNTRPITYYIYDLSVVDSTHNVFYPFDETSGLSFFGTGMGSENGTYTNLPERFATSSLAPIWELNEGSGDILTDANEGETALIQNFNQDMWVVRFELPKKIRQSTMVIDF